MDHSESQSEVRLHINKPCPKSWSELSGAGKQRFCSECSLHVHDAAQLTRIEAREVVSSATSRVCMRIEYDAAGAPIYSDSMHKELTPTTAARFKRWAVAAAAGLLAACHGSISTPAVVEPGTGDVPAGNTKMGKVHSTVMGDVALPEDRALMGEVSEVPPQEPPIDAPVNPEQR
jgi:hypothetical protein